MVKWLKSTNKDKTRRRRQEIRQVAIYYNFRSRQVLLVTSENANQFNHTTFLCECDEDRNRNHTKICCMLLKALKT